MANAASFLAANETFKKSFKDGDKASPPARKVAIVTCMDARFHVEPALGLQIGDAHVIRNAGGRVSDDALRSLAISERLLGTQEIFVIHHTDCENCWPIENLPTPKFCCRMAKFDNDHMCGVLKKDLGDAAEQVGKKIDWLTFKDAESSVKDDIKVIKDSPLIPETIPVHGYVYDVKNGGLIEVK